MIKELKIASFISLVIIGVYLGVVYRTHEPLEDYAVIGLEVFAYAFSLTLINFRFHSFLSKKYSWKNEPQKRLMFGILGSIIGSVIGFGLIRAFISVIFYGTSLSTFIANERISYYIIALGISMLTTSIFHIFYFYKATQEKKLSSQKIKTGVATAQLDALKTQLDPHFLFNSLNVLTSLIEESPEKAQDFTTTLSRVYRYVLEKKHEDLVSLEEEIDFGKAYMKLLKMRFEEGLRYEFPAVLPQENFKISPLSLQLLLENTIKHNIVSEEQPLFVKVYISKGRLYVENNKQHKNSLHSSGMGLQNIIQRYASLTEEKVVIADQSASFTVELPLLITTKKIMDSTAQLLEEKRYRNAKVKVKKIMGFYYHLMVFVLVISFLAWLNYQTTSFPWVLFPLLGWGFGILGHGMEAYDMSLFFGKAWEERQISAILEKEKKDSSSNNKSN
ncbi:MAG: histidine kinase [Flavobacteriia bacterium]|nr:histidine kinase [Flavobacteriia bacterium]